MISAMGFLRATLGWGVVMYAIMYLAWSGFALYGLTAGVFGLIARLLILAAVTTIAARDLKVSWLAVPKYSAFWALTAAILDIILLVPFTGFAFYAAWNVWFGYISIIVIPMFTSRFFSRTRAVQE